MTLGDFDFASLDILLLDRNVPISASPGMSPIFLLLSSIHSPRCTFCYGDTLTFSCGFNYELGHSSYVAMFFFFFKHWLSLCIIFGFNSNFTKRSTRNQWMANLIPTPSPLLLFCINWFVSRRFCLSLLLRWFDDKKTNKKTACTQVIILQESMAC